MTDEYVRTKIKEALAATGDDKHDAQKLLITWAVRDQALLLGMAKPHLKAIAAAVIDHAVRHKSDDGDSGPDKFTRNEIDDIVATSAVSLDKRRASNVPPPKSTERQATTMRRLAAAFTRKKK
jgi:hypothetical protein